MMRARAIHRVRGFTLVELIAVTVVLGVLAAATAPIVASAGQAYASAATMRASAGDLAFALELVAREFRDGAGPVVEASPSAVGLAGGHRLERLGTTLWLTLPGEAPAPLCQDVGSLEIEYLGDDGATDMSGAPAQIQRLHLTAQSGGVRLATVVFLRGATP